MAAMIFFSMPDEKIYAFTRTLDDDRLLVILNFSTDLPAFNLPENIKFTSSELLISNYMVDTSDEIRHFTLQPYEARVYRLRSGLQPDNLMTL